MSQVATIPTFNMFMQGPAREKHYPVTDKHAEYDHYYDLNNLRKLLDEEKREAQGETKVRVNRLDILALNKIIEKKSGYISDTDRLALIKIIQDNE